MKIVFSGGGTLGPVTPLLAVIEELRAQSTEHEFLWIGTERGAELPLIRKAGVQTVTIPSGKLRRYFDKKNFSDLIRIIKGFWASYRLLREFRPDVVISAGGFVSVPVHYSAWVLGIPTIVHQQDIVIGLANRVMSWIATRVTVSAPEQITKIGRKKNVVVGNPIRPSVCEGSREIGVQLFRVKPDVATVFAFGGGTGSQVINETIEQVVRECGGQFQIIHLTGTDRVQPQVRADFYHPYPFLMGEMAHAYAVSDVIIARAGFNAITEISAWGKPAILVPMFGSHQEANARFVESAGAAIVIDELSLSAEALFTAIREIISDEARYEAMSNASSALLPKGATARFVGVIDEVVASQKRLTK